MAYELDPYGVESAALLKAVDFRNANVLEIGTGDGRLTMRYLNDVASVVGVEPKFDDLESAVRKCEEKQRCPATFVQAKSESLPFRGNSFDIAVLAWSF